MTVVYEQFLYVLLQGYFKPVLSLHLVLLIYYDKTFGHEPGHLTRSVLNRQASISFCYRNRVEIVGVVGTRIPRLACLRPTSRSWYGPVGPS